MRQNFCGYGVFINGEYQSCDDFDVACDYFDSAVALGIVTEGRVVGWYDMEGCITLYDQTEVLECK